MKAEIEYLIAAPASKQVGEGAFSRFALLRVESLMARNAPAFVFDTDLKMGILMSRSEQ